MDPVAAADQRDAAIQSQATILATFRDALTAAGFNAEDAQELLVIWYDQTLTDASMRMFST